MIVKNEAHVIRRCLASVLPLLDAWVIVDTGSSDGTQASVRECLAGLPGELLERPWVDFAHNRTESLRLAGERADFLLILDADEVLEAAPGFNLPALRADAYDFEMRSGPLSYYKTQLVRASLPWRYQGVVHEHITCDSPRTHSRLAGVLTRRIPDGARSRDPLTYRRDALLLEEAVLREPANNRHMFYLAQSYADAGETDLAINRYQKRVSMGGWDEEVWCSMFQIARLREQRGDEWPAVQQAYLEAFGFRPSRAEPLFRVGAHFQARREFALAHLFFARAVTLPYPASETLYVEREIYRYLLPLEYAVACFYVGDHQEAIRVGNQLLADTTLSAEQRDHVHRNRQYSLDAVAALHGPDELA